MPPYHCRSQLLRDLDVELHPHQRRESEEKLIRECAEI